MPKANDLIGSYQLIRKLGAGGFGEVWPRPNHVTPAQRPRRSGKWAMGLLAGVLVIGALTIYLATYLTADPTTLPSFTGGGAASAGQSFFG